MMARTPTPRTSPPSCQAPSTIRRFVMPRGWHRSYELGVIPILRKPICQWNNQNWRIEREGEGEGDTLLLPVCQDGQVGQIGSHCALVAPEGRPDAEPPGLASVVGAPVLP